MKAIFLGWCMAVLAGCATAPSAQDMAAADYGSPITQADAEAAAMAFLRPRLKDPMSAHYEWAPVEKSYLAGAPIVGRRLAYGYALRGTINAKNSFGGYTGGKVYEFLFHDGVIVHALVQECLSGGGCYMAPID